MKAEPRMIREEEPENSNALSHPDGVIVTVLGGVAEVHTCPPSIDVLIVDYDNLDCAVLDDVDEKTAKWLQQNDMEYWERLRKRKV